MKFQPDTLPGANMLSRHEPGCVWVGDTPFAHSLLVPWRGEVRPWRAAHFDELGPDSFGALLGFAPEVVIFGSGARLRFPPAAWLRRLIEQRIGVESMDTAAACRTYNVLAAEGRSVLAALLIESDNSGFGPK
jgi:uncharacterized protein